MTIAELKDKYGNVVFRIFTSSAECRKGQYRMHRHTQYEIGLIESGCGFYDTEHGKESIATGDVFTFSANEYHCITDIFPCDGENAMHILNIHFLPAFVSDEYGEKGERFMRVFTDRKADFHNKLDENNRFLGEIQKLLLDIKNECENKLPCFEVVVRGLLCSLLVRLYRDFGLCEQRDNVENRANFHLGPIMRAAAYINEHYTENNPVEKNTVAGKAAKAKEKELEEWLRGLEGMDRLVDDYVGDKIPLWEKIMDRQGTVCCTWEKTAFEEGLKVGIRLMMEVYSL